MAPPGTSEGVAMVAPSTPGVRDTPPGTKLGVAIDAARTPGVRDTLPGTRLGVAIDAESAAGVIGGRVTAADGVAIAAESKTVATVIAPGERVGEKMLPLSSVALTVCGLPPLGTGSDASATAVPVCVRFVPDGVDVPHVAASGVAPPA